MSNREMIVKLLSDFGETLIDDTGVDLDACEVLAAEILARLNFEEFQRVAQEADAGDLAGDLMMSAVAALTAPNSDNQRQRFVSELNVRLSAREHKQSNKGGTEEP